MSSKQTSGSAGLARGWLLLGIVYAVFFYWYTPLGGPLSREEITHFSEVLEQSPGMDDERVRAWVQFMETDTGDDWAMWNAVELADHPEQIPGVGVNETSEEVVGRYAEPFFLKSFQRASHPVLMGDAAAPALDIWGIEGGERWDSGLLVRYRSRRDIMEILEEIVTSEDSIYAFKVAARHKTIAFPLDPWFHPGDPRLLLGLIFLVLGLLLQLRHNRKARS